MLHKILCFDMLTEETKTAQIHTYVYYQENLEVCLDMPRVLFYSQLVWNHI